MIEGLEIGPKVPLSLGPLRRGSSGFGSSERDTGSAVAALLLPALNSARRPSA